MGNGWTRRDQTRAPTVDCEPGILIIFRGGVYSSPASSTSVARLPLRLENGSSTPRCFPWSTSIQLSVFPSLLAYEIEGVLCAVTVVVTNSIAVITRALSLARSGAMWTGVS